MSPVNELWVLVELDPQDHPRPSSLQLLAKGRELTAKGGNILVGLVPAWPGKGEEGARQALRYGARRVHLLEHEGLGDPQAEVWAALLQGLLREQSPQALLMAASPFGQELAARLAGQLDAGLLSHCIDLAWDKAGELRGRKSILRGEWDSVSVFKPGALRLFTLLPAFLPPPEEARGKGEGEIVRQAVALDPAGLPGKRVLRREERPPGLADLEESEVIVAGGYGLGSTEAFRLIEELARALGGAVGASKKAVDAQWIPKAHLVGNSGHTVMPRLYLAIGISGASQHLRGMKAASTVVAINTDPYAPIFHVADFGIVGDARKVLPALLSELKGSGSGWEQLLKR
ncbi:MAG: electron transfer flavoprotein subunit alpha/FixB family protein [Candidatus Tectomicrobia bacterium]|uniref:Electron transfer flavoprotein subunit alpha/FixB family protein n=1 Tax=Tectimicrobiota bacterium TaxID=2528274 RepID=A0A932CQX5_UNCTE|nr:electron transfer flavoprotein subunit alpha/FixB family protein [Candidatus Tectomicrobia bacterium]